MLGFYDRAAQQQGGLDDLLVRRLRATGYITERVQALRYVRRLPSDRHATVDFVSFPSSNQPPRGFDVEMGLGTGGLG